MEYLTKSRVKITWTATKCNFAEVKRIRIQQVGRGVEAPLVVSNSTTNWDNETEMGYQIVENVTLVQGESYQWNISVLYGEGEEQTWSQPSETFSAAVTGNEITKHFSKGVVPPPGGAIKVGQQTGGGESGSAERGDVKIK